MLKVTKLEEDKALLIKTVKELLQKNDHMYLEEKWPYLKMIEEMEGKPLIDPPTVRQIKDLREHSGAGLHTCKAALIKCGNDELKALDYLRHRGL